METIYKWEVTSLYTVSTPEQGFVVNASYKVSGNDGTYSSEMSSIMSFSFTEGQTVIPFDSLTEDIVISWIQSELEENGITSITACIDGQIDSQKNPPVSPEITPLPWN
jgi:hypothetical protein